MKQLFFIVGLCMLCLAACRDSLTETQLPAPEPGFNPYDTINYDNDYVPNIPVDSTTFLGLHMHIFSTTCNQPACHDGTFEPDFRTVQSAYNTLVLHPIKKNYASGPLPYRVTPGDANASMMYKRITAHNPPNFERMPSSGNPLSDDKISLIRNWINDGAKDVYGQVPMQSSRQPTSYGMAAFIDDENGFRLDTIRGDFAFNPFYVPAGEVINLWFFYLDVTPANDSVFGQELTYNRIKLSANPFDFTNAVELNMQVPFIPMLLPSAFSQPIVFPLPYYQNATFDPADYGFGVGDIVYIRTYVQDSDHPQPTEIPKSESPFYLQNYFAFIIQ